MTTSCLDVWTAPWLFGWAVAILSFIAVSVSVPAPAVCRFPILPPGFGGQHIKELKGKGVNYGLPPGEQTHLITEYDPIIYCNKTACLHGRNHRKHNLDHKITYDREHALCTSSQMTN